MATGLPRRHRHPYTRKSLYDSGNNGRRKILAVPLRSGEERRGGEGSLAERGLEQPRAVVRPQRSAWIAKETKPLNWNDVADIENADELTFPQHEQSKPFEWSRAPRTNVLPDKFVVMLYQGDTIVKEIPGGIIPDELFMGPDPLEADAAFVEAAEDQTLTFGSEFDWTSDFDKAVNKGMGFRIPLNADEAARVLIKYWSSAFTLPRARQKQRGDRRAYRQSPLLAKRFQPDKTGNSYQQHRGK